MFSEILMWFRVCYDFTNYQKVTSEASAWHIRNEGLLFLSWMPRYESCLTFYFPFIVLIFITEYTLQLNVLPDK